MTVFDEDTPHAVLAALRPDVWVKGGDYAGAGAAGGRAARRWGGQVVVVPYLAGRSTTGLVRTAQRDRDDDCWEAGWLSVHWGRCW